jgi:AcrR family transcriptional regulator
VAATSPRSGGKAAAGSWQWARTAETQRSLLDAAREVFTEQGFSESSIADVVERAGSSVGSLYHHFGGKSELFIALWQEYTQAQEASASAAVARAKQDGVTDAYELFSAGARGYLEGAWERRDLSLLFNAGDGPPGFELMRRRRGREWIGQNDTLLKLSDTSLNRLYATILTSLTGEGAREVAASRTRAQANKIIDAVLEYTRRLMTGGPWQPAAKDAKTSKAAKTAKAGSGTTTAKRSGSGRAPSRRTTSREPATR